MFPSWKAVQRYREVIIFAAGQMKDSRPLVQYVYEMQVEDYLNEMRTDYPSIDADLFKWLQAESRVQLFDDPLHNKYINYYNHYDRWGDPTDTTAVYFPSQVYDFRFMSRGVVLEDPLTQGEEIPPCAMEIWKPDEAVSDSLLSICSQISTRQPVTDLWMRYVTCNSLEAPRLIKPQTVALFVCKFPKVFMQILLRQLIECHCGETLQELWLGDMNLRPFESLLDELLEDLVAHHEAGLAQRKLRLWFMDLGPVESLIDELLEDLVAHHQRKREAGLAQRELELGHPTNLSEEFVEKWRNRCKKVDSIDCRIDP